MNIQLARFAFLLSTLLLPAVSSGGIEICPSISLGIDNPAPVCSMESMTVGAWFTELPGLCRDVPVTYLDKQWTWAVEGVEATPSSGKGSSATFTNITGGEGSITFALRCRVRACEDCNTTFAITTNFTAIKVDIAESNVVLCSYDTSATLSLTGDSYSPSGFVWNSTLWKKSKDGASVSFDPSTKPPGIYTVLASSRSRSACSDDCQVSIVRVDLDVDSNLDGVCDEADELIEDGSGRFLGVNNDDDNANGTNDLDEAGVVVGENDLVPIYLNIDPKMPTGMVILDAPSGGDKIRVWKSASKDEEVHLPMTWYPAAGTVPDVRYIEGIQPSDQSGDVRLRLRYLVGSAECADEISMSVLKVDIDVDSNNDWAINAADSLVETNRPGFKFWINDRNSYESVPSAYWEVGFGGSSGADNADDSINGIRDLEDFALLRLWLDKDIVLPAGYRYQLELIGPAEIRVFRRIGESYLTDMTEARQQVKELTWGSVSSEKYATINADKFIANEQYIIFEGVKSGQSTLRFVLRDSADQVVCADEVELSLVDIRDRYSRATTRNSFGQRQETVASEYGPIQSAIYEPDCNCYVRQPIAWKTVSYDCYKNVSFTDNHLDVEKNKVFIWMHGFNVSDENASIWFDTMFKRLYWSKYEGDFLGIAWEGNEGSPAEFLTYYNKNVENAFQSAQAVADFVTAVAPAKTKVIGAHSLGNMVMLEALRILSVSGVQPVRNVVNMQAAVPGDVYESEANSLVMQLLNSLNAWRGYFRPSIAAAQGYVLNTHSQKDEVLDGLLLLNEFIKPVAGIVMFWLWDNNGQAYLHPQMESALGLVSVSGQHPALDSKDVFINQTKTPYGIRDHSSMKNELFLDVEDFFIILKSEIQ